VAGWILAFALLRASPLPAHGQRPWEVGLVVMGLAALLLLLLSWCAQQRHQAFCPNPAISSLRGPRAWGLMLATGVLMGLLQHSHWPWDPSSLARGLGLALTGAELPSATACALLLPLGMAITHQWRGQIQPRLPVVADLKLLLWGLLMGLGTVWGMGANDGYLFRYLPLGSMHAAAGLAAMTVGILLSRPFRLSRSS